MPTLPSMNNFGCLCSINEYSTWETMSSRSRLLQLLNALRIWVRDSSSSWHFCSLTWELEHQQERFAYSSFLNYGGDGADAFLHGHEGSLLFSANSAGAAQCPELNPPTGLQRGHCWQFLQLHLAQLCKPAAKEMGGRNFPSSFEGI